MHQFRKSVDPLPLGGRNNMVAILVLVKLVSGLRVNLWSVCCVCFLLAKLSCEHAEKLVETNFTMTMKMILMDGREDPPRGWGCWQAGHRLQQGGKGIRVGWPPGGTGRPGLRAERGPSGLRGGRTLREVRQVNNKLTPPRQHWGNKYHTAASGYTVCLCVRSQCFSPWQFSSKSVR